MSFENIRNISPTISHSNITETTKPKMVKFSADELKQMEREKERLGRKIFKNPIDSKRLALVHGETFIRGTYYEGGSPVDSLQAWKSMLESWKNRESEISIGLEDKEIDLLLDDFSTAEKAYKKTGEELFNFISEELERKNLVALPIYYAGKEEPATAGHVFGAIFEKDAKGKIRCWLVDKGEASGMHPIVSFTGKPKRSYRFFPILLKDNFFKKTEKWSFGKEFFNRLVQYQFSPEIDDEPYTSEEIYNLFLQIGEVEEDKKEATPFKEEEGVTSQRSGTCAEMFCRLILRDLLTRRLDLIGQEAYVKYRRSIFAEKFSTLHEACNSNGPIPVELLKQCTEDFALSVEKHYTEGRIERSEYIKSYALIELAREKIALIETSKPAPITALPSLTVENPELPTVSKPSIEDISATWEKSDVPSYKPIDISRPKPEILLNSLRNCLKTCKEDSNSKRAMYTAYHQILNLPIPGGEEDSYWDEVPEAEINDCLKCLQELTEEVQERDRKLSVAGVLGAHYPTILLLSLTGLAITDRLARRDPLICYDDYCIKPNFASLEGYHQFFYPLGSDSKRFNQLKSYLESKKDKTALFDFREGCLEFHKVVESLHTQSPISPVDEPLRNHLLYLKKILPKIRPQGLDRNETLKYLSLIGPTEIDYGRGKRRDVVEKIKLKDSYEALEFFALQTDFLLFDALGSKNNSYETDSASHMGFIGKAQRDDKPGQRSFTAKIERGFRDFTEKKKDGIIKQDRFNGKNIDLKFLFERHGLENYLFVRSLNDTAQLPTTVLRDLLKIRLKDDLIVPSLVKWCKENPEYAKNKEAQAFIELFLLEGKELTNKLTQEPLVIENLRSTFDEKISESIDPTKFNQALFWLILAFHAETKLAQSKETNEEIYNERLKKLQKDFDLLKKSVSTAKEVITPEEKNSYLQDIATAQAYLASIPFPNTLLSEEGVIQLISNRALLTIYASEKSSLPFWILEEVESQFFQHSARIEELLQDKEVRKKAVEPILLKLGIDSQKIDKDSLIYDFPKITASFNREEIEINLLDATVRQNGQLVKIGKWPSWLKPRDCSVVCSQAEPEIVTPNDNLVVALDGSFRIFRSTLGGTGCFFEKKISFDGKEQYYQYIKEPSAFGIPGALFSGEKTCWSSTEKPKFFLILNKDGTPYARSVLINDGKTEIIRLSGSKVSDLETSEKLLKMSKNSEWHHFLEKVAPISSILAWGKKSGEETELTRLEFTEFENLSFTVSQKETPKRLFCDQLQGYYLSPEQGEKSLHFLKGSLTLEKIGEPNKKYLILPAAQLVSNPIEGKYSEHLEGLQEFFDKEQKSFVYEISKDGRYISNSQTAMLYLIYALKKQGNFLEANNYIEQFQHQHYFNDFDLKIIGRILSPEGTLEADFSPQTASLSMKIGLLLADNEAQILKGKNDRNLTLIDNLSRQCDRYLQFSAKDDVNHIPYYLRIDPKQTKRVLKFLKEHHANFLFSTDLFWSSLNKEKLGEHKQYMRRDYNVRVFFDELIDFDLRTGEFIKNIEWEFAFITNTGNDPLDGIRTKASDIRKNFFNLFDEARQCNKDEPAPFDLKLFHFYNQIKTNRFLLFHSLKILYLVRLYPEKFQDLIIPSSDESIENIRKEFILRFQAIGDEIKEAGYANIPREKRAIPVTVDLGKVPEERFAEKPLIPKKSFQINAHLVDKPLRPLKPILKGFYNKSKEEILTQDQKGFALKDQNTEVGLAERLRKDLTEAHRNINQNKVYAKYQFKDIDNVSGLRKSLEKEIGKKEEILSKLKVEIENLANYPSGDDLEKLSEHDLDVFQHKMRIFGKQRPQLTLESDVMIAVLNKDYAALQTLNPFLTEEICLELYHKTIEYELAGSYLDQCKEALPLVKEAESSQDLALQQAKLTGAAEIMDKKREYNPYKYPELLFYEYSLGVMLRNEPNQAQLLKDIFALIFDNPPSPENRDQLRKLFFEFQAGGGKTKVISAIVAFKAISEGKKPVFFSLPELFDITKKDLQVALNTALKRKTRTLNIDLDTELDLKELKKIYKGCKRSLGTCDVMKPETFHALNLRYQEALHEGNVQKVNFLSKIMSFYEQEGVFLIDESHRNADSLLQANFAFGRPFPIPEYERNFLLNSLLKLAGLSDPLLTLEDGRSVTDVLGLRENKQAFLLPEQRKEVLKVLAKSFLEDPLLDIKEEDREGLLTYLLDLKLSPPTWLTKRENSSNKKEQEQAKLITLLRGLTTVILPHTLGLSGLMDYGPSLKTDDPVEAPRRQMKPSQCKFELPDIAAVLSIQGRLQRGLMQPFEMQKALTHLKEEMLQEAKIYQSAEKTPTSKAFIEWQKDSAEKIRLEDIDAEKLMDNAFLERMISIIGKEPKLIRVYISKIVLPAIDVYPYKLTSTAADLLAGCHSPISFSATLGSFEQYPYLADPENYYMEDTAFQADVIQRACLAHNREIISVTPSTPYQFFADLYAKNPKAFERLDGLINLGGLCKEFSNEEWGQQLMQFAQDKGIPIDGTLFFKEEAKVPGDLPEKSLYLLLKGQKTPIRLETTDLKKELSKLGLLDKRIFKIYGPSETTGTDLLLAKDAKMLLTLGESVTLSYLIQAIMRMRQFLKSPIDPETAQSLFWVIPEGLKEVIRQSLKLKSDIEITPEHCFEWALLQEAERQKKSIVMRALQEIQFVIRNRIKNELRAQLKSPEEQIKIFKAHEKAFLLDLGRDPFSAYGQGSIEMDTEKVLMAQANNFAQKANVPLDENPVEKKRIEQIIHQTKQVVDKIAAKASEDLSANAHQHQQQERQQEAKQEQQAQMEQNTYSYNAFNTKRALMPLKYAEDELSLQSDDITKNLSPNHQKVSSLYETSLFSSDLMLGKNVFETIERQENFPRLVKSIDYFLMIEEEVEGKPVRKALALSVDDAESYQKQLLTEQPFGQKKNRRAALFSSNGMIAQNGKNPFGFSGNDLKALSQDPWFKDVLFDLNLINGKVQDEKKMIQLMRKKPAEVKALWQKIVDTHVDSKSFQHVLMWHLTKKAEQEGLLAEKVKETAEEIQPPVKEAPPPPLPSEEPSPVEEIPPLLVRSNTDIEAPSIKISADDISSKTIPQASTPKTDTVKTAKTLTKPLPTKRVTPWAAFKALWQQKTWAKLLTIFTAGLAIPFFLVYFRRRNRKNI